MTKILRMMVALRFRAGDAHEDVVQRGRVSSKCRTGPRAMSMPSRCCVSPPFSRRQLLQMPVIRDLDHARAAGPEVRRSDPGARGACRCRRYSGSSRACRRAPSCLVDHEDEIAHLLSHGHVVRGKITVVPLRFKSRTASRSTTAFTGSRPLNGSSSKTSSGLATTVAMNCTFCDIPLEAWRLSCRPVAEIQALQPVIDGGLAMAGAFQLA